MREFIEVADSLYNTCSNDAEENEFYDQVNTQLRGEARNVAMRMTNLQWHSLKKNLLSNFEVLSNKNILMSQIENLRQEKDESLSQYAERTRKLLNEKNITYTAISEEQRAEHNRTARKAFARGIKNNSLREKMSIRGASSLEDAIAYALEAESENLSQIPQSELFCKACRVPCYRQIDCRRSGNESMNQIVTALQALGIGNQNSFPNNQINRQFNNTSNRFGNNFNRNGRDFNRNSLNNFNRNWNSPNNFNRNWNGPNNFNRNWNEPTNFNRNWSNNNQNSNNRNNNFNNNGFNNNRNWNNINSQNSANNNQSNQNEQNSQAPNSNRMFGQMNQ